MNFSENCEWFEKPYQKLERVFNQVPKHLEVSLKKLGCTSIFQPAWRCLDILLKHFLVFNLSPLNRYLMVLPLRKNFSGDLFQKRFCESKVNSVFILNLNTVFILQCTELRGKCNSWKTQTYPLPDIDDAWAFIPKKVGASKMFFYPVLAFLSLQYYFP